MDTGTFSSFCADSFLLSRAAQDSPVSFARMSGYLVVPRIHGTSNIQILIKSIKYRLITKTITQMEANLQDDFFKSN